MFKFHGFSGPCPKPPLRPKELIDDRPRNPATGDLYPALSWLAWPPPQDGKWVIALMNDGCSLLRVSWGRDRDGELAWCSVGGSYGDGLFTAWISWPEKPEFLQS